MYSALLLQLISLFCATLLAVENETALTPDEIAEFAWFDSLGYPDVSACMYVHVATGRWSKSGNNEPVNSYQDGFLLQDKDGAYTIFTPSLETETFIKTAAGVKDFERVEYTVIDLEKAARQRLAEAAAQAKEGKRFGERLGEQAEMFAVARFCASKGHAQLAHDLLIAARALPQRQQSDPPNRSFRQLVADEIATAQMWQGILAFEDTKIPRKDLLTTFKRIAANFPESKHASRARETVEILEKMVAEDDAWAMKAIQKQQNLSDDQRTADLIFLLRDQNGHQWSQPGSCDIFDDARGKESPAQRLVAMGFSAVPALIEAVDDVRFTRSVDYHRDFYFSHHVLRIGDCVLAILQRIANRSFYNFTYTNAAMVKDHDGATTKENIKAWWADFQAKGERSMLVEATEAGDVQQADALCRKFPADAAAAITAGLNKTSSAWQRAELIEKLADLDSDAAWKVVLRELHGGPSLRTRVAAAAKLLQHGRSEGIPVMCDLWTKLPAVRSTHERDENCLLLVPFLVGCGRADAIRVLGENLANRPVDVKYEVISAFKAEPDPLFPAARAQPLKPSDPNFLAAVEEVLVAALADTEEREGMSASWGSVYFEDPRICDVAGYILGQRYQDRYLFDASATLAKRDEQRLVLQNIWRQAHGKVLLPLPKPREQHLVPDIQTGTLLDQVMRTDDAQAYASVIALGLGALPATAARMQASTANPIVHARLEALASTIANTVDVVSISSSTPDPDLAALQGKPLTSSTLRQIILRLAHSLPAGSRGFRLSAYRGDDLMGLSLAISYIAASALPPDSQNDWGLHGKVMVGQESLYNSSSSGDSQYQLKSATYDDFVKAADRALAAGPRKNVHLRITLRKEE